MNKAIGQKSRILSIIMLAVLSCVLMAVPALAEDAGDGSGGGQGVPLGLAASIPADGQKDVVLTGDIKLTFNKNVIYLLIRENNKKCFSLIAADGSKVPIEVIMADDQIHPEEKRNISIHPLARLLPGTAYTLKISPELQAKNGTSLGHEVSVNFVTAGTAVKPAPLAPVAPASEPVKPEEAVKPAPTGEKDETSKVVPSPVAAENATVAEEEKTAVAEKAQVADDKAKQLEEKPVKAEEKTPLKKAAPVEQKPNRAYAIIVGVLLVAGAGYLQARKRKQK